MKKFSEMTNAELDREMQHLIAEQRKKEQAGFYSEANVLEQKFYLAKSYRMNKRLIKPDHTYNVIGEEGKFQVNYLNGVFAWGTIEGSEEERAFPIARLEDES